MTLAPRADDRIKVSVPEQARSVLEAMRDPSSRVGRVAAELFGAAPTSEASAAGLLLLVGMKQVQEAARRAGYEALAQDLRQEPDAVRQAEREHRNRRAAAWADA